MGFDQHSNRPLVGFRKWTTKINIGIIVSVVVFLSLGALTIYFWQRQADTEESIELTPVVVTPAAPTEPAIPIP